ncbi:MAG: dTDP-glucose 4,6-dehydratase [Rubrobacter sp.]|nr:dTDP-glucose 4,6-dehydratase [Rubrobacter sp.]
MLVTGGAGFIGSNYVRYALETRPDWHVVVLDKLTYSGSLENLAGLPSERFSFVQGDIADPAVVRKVVQGAQYVLNFAAESHVDRSLQDPRPFVKTNVEGTLVLLEESLRAGVGRFLHVSTDEVYGDIAGSVHHSLEQDPLRPRSPYAATKAAAEHLVMSYHVSYGLDAVITRGSNTYGPRQYPEKIIPLFVVNTLQDKPLPVYGDGSAVRDYLHVSDHCAGIDAVLHGGASGEAYNLGGREQINGVLVAQTILAALGKPDSLIAYVPDRPGHDYRYSVDPAAAEKLGWERRFGFEEGLRETVGWYLENPDWWRKIGADESYASFIRSWYVERSAR